MRFPYVKTATITFAAALAAGVAVCSSSEAAPEVTAACRSNFAALKVSAPMATAAEAFVDVPESNVRFVQGGAKAGCIVVSFSAEAFAEGQNIMLVVAVLDGTTRCEPDDSLFVHDTQSIGTWTMNYVCTGVTPGTHGVKLQFRGRGGPVHLFRRTVIVHHFR